MTYPFTMPARTFLGENALETAEPAIRQLGQKALIVTGKIVTRIGTVKLVTDRLTLWGIEFTVFNDITDEPTDQMIEAGVRAYREAGCDFLVAVGGGSPLDSAKAIAAMTVLPGSLPDYMGMEIKGDFPPMVLIPTTAGTGSEATKFTIVTDTKQGVKMLLKGDALLPDVAVVDPAFTVSAPQSVTMATGMDALTHAVESYLSKKANPLTDLYAKDAVRRIFEFLPRAFEDGNDKQAREEMAVAAYEAGICINNSSVTLVHGMSRPIGALFHVPHGLSNAMLLLTCLEFVRDGCPDRFADLGRSIRAAGAGAGDDEAARAFLEALRSLCVRLEIPTLAEYGIAKAEFDGQIEKMAADAMASGSPSNTRKELTKEDLIRLYRRLW